MMPRSQRHLVIRGATVVAMDGDRRVAREDILITDGRIAAMGPRLETPPATRLLDATGLYVFPGFIQGHVHLGQALFRGLAENRELLSWLKDRIWPLEAAHTEESAYWSSMLGAADCLLSGTTTIQEFGLVRGMEGVFRAIRDSGLRAVGGKCLMDSGEDVPPPLLEDPRASLEEAEALFRDWDGEAGGRIHGEISPRFILSCSRELWEGTAVLAERLDAPVHTHLLESRREEEAVRERLGVGQVEFLDQTGILDTDLRVAHGVWLTDRDLETLAGRRLGVVHCPSANLKLGSGIADLPRLRSPENLAVGIGTDGAPCNNDMDVLEEMRLAALLQQWKNGPGSVSSRTVLELATIEGARALGMEDEIGSLEPGKRGDLVVLDLDRPATFGANRVSVYDRVVYAAGRDAVRWVVVDGEILVENGAFPHLDEEALRKRPSEEIRHLLSRAEIDWEMD